MPAAIQATIADAELEQLEHWRERFVTAPGLAAIFSDNAHQVSARGESQAMLGITDIDLEQTRFYQDVLAEGRQEGQTKGRQAEATRLLRSLLTRRFGPLPDWADQHLSQATTQ